MKLTVTFVVLLLTNGYSWTTLAQSEPEDREIELQSLRSRIKDVRSTIDEATRQTNQYLDDIRQSELAIAEVAANLEEIESRAVRQEETLASLHQESLEQQLLLKYERKLLAEQVRSAYKTGRNDFIKLLLNQEDPTLVDRVMTYHDYYNKARTERITEINITLRNLDMLETRIDTESQELESLHQQQLQELKRLEQHRGSRSGLIANLQAFIDDRGLELRNLEDNEKNLAELVSGLKDVPSVMDKFETLSPFNTLKGKLKWPLSGKLITQYGTAKKGGKLRWRGVRISAEPGAGVNAISAGKVVFADWFRNMGLLIILDHGGGYMSLYGHNERLLKKSGDFVNTGEQIARAGNTGGQSETALYFEVRRQGEHLNPALWCKR